MTRQSRVRPRYRTRRRVGTDGGRDRPAGESGQERRGYRVPAGRTGRPAGEGGDRPSGSEGGYRAGEAGRYGERGGTGRYGATGGPPGQQPSGGYGGGRQPPGRQPPGGPPGQQPGEYGRGGQQPPGEYGGAGQRSARRQYGPTGGGRTAAPRGMETARYPEQFVDHLTPEMRMLLDDSIEASQVAAWCADRCIEHGPEAGDCVRLCNEVAQIADLNANLISKDAFNVLPVTEAFVSVAEQALVELEEIPQVHAEETRAVLERAIDSAENVL